MRLIFPCKKWPVFQWFLATLILLMIFGFSLTEPVKASCLTTCQGNAPLTTWTSAACDTVACPTYATCSGSPTNCTYCWKNTTTTGCTAPATCKCIGWIPCPYSCGVGNCQNVSSLSVYPVCSTITPTSTPAPPTPTPTITPTPTPTITPTPTPAPCAVTTSPSTAINLVIGGAIGTVTANVTSGLGSATINQMRFGSYNTSIATVNPTSDSTSPYSTTVTAVAAGATAVWGTADLSDGRTCPSTGSTDTDINVTAPTPTPTPGGPTPTVTPTPTITPTPTVTPTPLPIICPTGAVRYVCKAAC